MAQATTAIAGYNSFLFETDHVVGRMEGSGGKVALQFNMPGEHADTLNHRSSGRNMPPRNVSRGGGWSTKSWKG